MLLDEHEEPSVLAQQLQEARWQGMGKGRSGTRRDQSLPGLADYRSKGTWYFHVRAPPQIGPW